MGLVGHAAATLACASMSAVTIMQIQGSDHFSPIEGRFVETTGVVTWAAAGDEGFFLQDAAGDGASVTSDGIFVSPEGAAEGIVFPSVGDFVRVRALVEESRSGRALPRTQLTRVTRLEIVSSGNPLPRFVEIEELPEESLKEGKAFWEPLEGMVVSLRSALVIAPTSRFGEFAILTEANTTPGSGFYRASGHIRLRPLGGNEVDYNPERILVTDGLERAAGLRPGDRVRELVGIVDYAYGNYKIRASRIEVEPQAPPETPVSTRSGPEGDWVVTTFNVENLFDLERDPEKDDEDSTPSPEALEIKLKKLASAIQAELRVPEILVVQEVENAHILSELARRVNESSGTSYVATSMGSSDPRGIEVGFLWDRDRVSLQEAYLLSGPDVEEAFGPSSESPGREPLVGRFEIRGSEVTIIGNHFKSKGGDDPLYGVKDPAIRSSEVQRKAQARVVRDFVDSRLAKDHGAWVLVAGDLNDFEFGEPGEGPDHPLAILEGEVEELSLSNLILREDEHERYTYIYEGNSQVLDHLLVSPALLEHLAAVDILHFNASYPAAWSGDAATHLRSSDHDAVEARFVYRRH